MQWLENQGIHVRAWVHQIQHCAMHEINEMPSLSDIESNPVRCPDSKTANNMIHAIEKAKEEGDSLGGIIAFRAEGLPIGVGEPVFGKIQAELGLYLLNINATTGLEFGDGFKASTLRGSEHNDSWIPDEKKLASSHSNHSGGSIGGISTGLPLTGKLAFKPVSSIQKEQKTIDHEGRPVSIQVNGRHDPCVVPRAVPIVESMLALCLMDLVLEYNTYK
jgi:chorismate synthase